MNVILLGAPSSGKGTQAIKVCEKLNLPHISTGDIFRANIKNQTPLGVLAKTYIDSGKLVPDDVVLDIVKDRLLKEDCINGFVLDGFPRTIEQAEGLAEFAKIDAVINLDIDLNLLVERSVNRRVCLTCGRTYNVKQLNGNDVCECGDKLIQRKDDAEEIVKNRLNVYEAQTKPLINFYEEKGVLVNVNANDAIENVFNNIIKVLSK